MNPSTSPRTVARWSFILLFLAGAVSVVRAQSDADAADNDGSSYHQALLNYKGGKYEAARMFIDDAEKAQPDSVPVELLKARILTEQHDFKRAMQVLRSVADNPGLTPADGQALTLAYGDLDLRQHRFDQASKYYESFLNQKPGDPDVTLKLVYARLGVSDLVEAGKQASVLKPLDATNPAYYFARAALAKVTGDTAGEEQDIQQARTIYGITMTDRYLKTYLEVFSADKSSVSAALNPPSAATNSAPTDTIP